MQAIGNTPTPPGIKVLAYIDASEQVVEPWLAARVDSLEKAQADAGASMEAVARIHRVGASRLQKVAKGLMYAAAELAIPVVGGLAGGIPGLVLGGLGALAFGIVLGNHRQVMGNLASAWEQNKVMPDPLWKGQRTYHIQADKTPGIDSAASDVRPLETHPSPSELRSFLIGNMDPMKTNIVFIAGHGLGYRSTASMPLASVRAGLEAAASRNGRKADVVLMESCLMGNMEAVNELRDAARVAVLSEETLNVDALPLREMLADAAKQGGTPQEIGKRMVEAAGKTGKVQTLAAVDLDRVPALMSSLDTLGDALAAEIQQGRKADIQAAIKEAMPYPQGSMLFLERRMLHFSDLGGFLDALQTRPLDAATLQTAKDARKALDETVIAKATDGEYGKSSGLSFQSKVGFGSHALDNSKDMGPYAGLDLPDGWLDFIEAVS